MLDNCLIESMAKYIGQTVTIFTTSGGLSGNGFTGVLAGICEYSVKLITSIGAPPACPCGSDCTGWGSSNWGGGWGGCGGGYYGGFSGNWLGSVTEIPIDRIASFTHCAI
jgi:hypothetical protein